MRKKNYYSESLKLFWKNKLAVLSLLILAILAVSAILAPVLTGNDLILIQGAGNIGKIARTLAEIKLKPQTQEDEHHG